MYLDSVIKSNTVVDFCKLLLAHFKKNMVLVDCKYLRIVDSIHTRGASFWKLTRKVFLC
jgi:hypothetical protein